MEVVVVVVEGVVVVDVVVVSGKGVVGVLSVGTKVTFSKGMQPGIKRVLISFSLKFDLFFFFKPNHDYCVALTRCLDGKSRPTIPSREYSGLGSCLTGGAIGTGLVPVSTTTHVPAHLGQM